MQMASCPLCHNSSLPIPHSCVSFSFLPIFSQTPRATLTQTSLPETGCCVCVGVGGPGDGRWDDITEFIDPPSRHPRSRSGGHAEGMGLMGRLFPCLEVLHKHPQPCAHSHGYRMGKAGCGGITMAPAWPTAQPGMALAPSSSGLSLDRSLPGRALPGHPLACGVRWEAKRPGPDSGKVAGPLSPSAQQPWEQTCLPHQLTQHRRPEAQSWP